MSANGSAGNLLAIRSAGAESEMLAPVGSRNRRFARAKGATLRLFLIAAFCRLAKLLNYSKQRVGAMGIEPDRPLNLQ